MKSLSRSVVSDSLRPHELGPTRLLRLWDFPGKSTGVGCNFLLQDIFPTQGLNPASRIVGRCFTIRATGEKPFTKFTAIDPESEEGKMILKDRFLIQSALDICRKLLKWMHGPNQSSDTLLQLAQTVYYGREYEEKKDKRKRQRNR